MTGWKSGDQVQMLVHVGGLRIVSHPVKLPGGDYQMTYRLEDNPHPFTDICSDGCGDMSSPFLCDGTCTGAVMFRPTRLQP